MNERQHRRTKKLFALEITTKPARQIYQQSKAFADIEQPLKPWLIYMMNPAQIYRPLRGKIVNHDFVEYAL